MGGGWVEADLRCNLSDDILMESDPHRLVLHPPPLSCCLPPPPPPQSLVPMNTPPSFRSSPADPGSKFGVKISVKIWGQNLL